MSETASDIPRGLKVGIIGGSIAGCTAAIELVRLGCDVTLFERTGEELKDRGAGIGVPPSIIDTFISRDLVDADIPHFSSHTFTRIWRTDRSDGTGISPGINRQAWPSSTGGDCIATSVNACLTQSIAQRTAWWLSTNGRADALAWKWRIATPMNLTWSSAPMDIRRSDAVRYFQRLPFSTPGMCSGAGSSWKKNSVSRNRSKVGCAVLAIQEGTAFFILCQDQMVGAPGKRLVNWGVYVPVAEPTLAAFLTDKNGNTHEGSLPPGAMVDPHRNGTETEGI